MPKTTSYLLLVFLLCCCATAVFAQPKKWPQRPPSGNVTFRSGCTTAQAQVDLDVNNVRSRLTTGGDIWWDRDNGGYVVPKPAPGQPAVSAIYAAGVWMGGIDPGGNLKVACQSYGNANGQSDFWPGPLSSEGATDKYACEKWDRFFEVTAEEIRQHLALFHNAQAGIGTYTPDMIPAGLRSWPGKGNPYFAAISQFYMPDADQGMAEFWDEDRNGIYDPLGGDFPIVTSRGCNNEPPRLPDQMYFWVFNDEGGGNDHAETQGLPMRMEIQVQAFAYATDNAINDMTFQRYRFVNRAKEDLDSAYFGLWVDFDLGCLIDDNVGYDVNRNLS